MPHITKIAITGGPCAGKTSALAALRKHFSDKGYKVITVPEPATELIGNGITPWECSTSEEYQRCQMELQITRERMYERAARGMDYERVLIVFDRGMMDNKCYMTDEEFARVIAELGKTEEELRANYDAVFYLESAAKGAGDNYSLDTNRARYESPEEAAELDGHFITVWSAHPRFGIIHSTVDFNEKISQLLDNVEKLLTTLGDQHAQEQTH